MYATVSIVMTRSSSHLQGLWSQHVCLDSPQFFITQSEEHKSDANAPAQTRHVSALDPELQTNFKGTTSLSPILASRLPMICGAPLPISWFMPSQTSRNILATPRLLLVFVPSTTNSPKTRVATRTANSAFVRLRPDIDTTVLAAGTELHAYSHVMLCSSSLRLFRTSSFPGFQLHDRFPHPFQHCRSQ